MSQNREEAPPPSVATATANGSARPAERPAANGVQRRRRPAATLPELRAKAAFRACDRLMEQGAACEEQLWTVARVMCGEEYGQAAEERALAGKCGNPLCSHAPGSRRQQGGGRYHISALQQAVLDKRDDLDMPVYCGPGCEADSARFAARLGSGALALERFTRMYHMLQQQPSQGQQQPSTPPATSSGAGAAGSSAAAAAPVNGAAAAVAASAAPVAASAAASAADTPSPAAAASAAAAAASAAVAAAAAAGAAANGGAVAGAIGSPAVLAPRLAVEQVEVKHISSSAGQFGDFSRKPKPRAASAEGAAQPRGVLKKQSQFAAGSSKVPIMLAEVKERDPSVVAAETACGLHPGRAAGSRSAAAVEGYVPRARKQRQSQRRVRFTDDVLEAPEAGEEAAEVEEEQGEAGAAPASAHAAAPLPVPAAGSAAGSVLVFDVEDPKGPLEAGSKGLAAQFGRLYVADPTQLTAATTAAVGGGSGAPTSAPPANPPPPPLAQQQRAQPASRAASSSNISIQQPGYRASSSAALPREWLEVPQFYAHSPVGSSNSLAGSFASPSNSRSNLPALSAAATSPPPPAVQSPQRRYSSPPPGLPRGPASRAAAAPTEQGRQASGGGQDADNDAARGSRGRSLGARQPEGQPLLAAVAESSQPPQSDAQQPAGDAQQPGGGTPEQPEQPLMSRRQAEQLTRAFPPLAAVLPPEIQALLESSDSEDAVSEGADSEDWMRSDDDEEGEQGAASSSEEEGAAPGSRSNFRVNLSFFGTLFTHMEAWITPHTVELLAAGPDVEVALPPPTSPEVLAALSRCLAAALPPVLASLAAGAPRGQVDRCLDELLRTLRLVGPVPAFKVSQWQVLAVLLLKALSLERCPGLREAFETRDGIARFNRLLASLSFTVEEFWALLELLCPTD